jgi:short-subunit dehydrogenase
MKAHNKTIVVTGGGNGMGREMVLNLLNRGAKVAAVDMREDFLIETQNLAGNTATNLSVHVLNITDKAAVYRFFNEVIEHHGAVDGLINCAGIIQPFVKTVDLGFDAIEKVMNVNFYGSLYMIKAFLPHLLKRPEAHLVNISSMGGFLPVPGQSVYGASKAAIKLLTEALYAELLYTKVQVSVVFPGAIGTNISANSDVAIPAGTAQDTDKPEMKVLPPHEAAELIISGMEKNKTRIYVGNDSKFMNMLYRLSPGYATRLISKKMKSLLSD